MPTEERPLSPESQSILDRVLKAREGKYVTVTRDLDGVEVEMRFLPALSIPALEIVARVQKLTRSKEPDIMAQLQALVEFLDVMAEEETGALIGELLQVGAIDISEVAAIQQEVVALVAARPTTRSLSSPTGSPETGPSSTASALIGTLTPQPSPSTDS